MVALPRVPTSQQGCCQKLASFPQIIRKKLSECGTTDCKIHSAVVLGRFMQTIALMGTAGALVTSFLIGPLILLGIIPSLVMGGMGTWLADFRNPAARYPHPPPPPPPPPQTQTQPLAPPQSAPPSGVAPTPPPPPAPPPAFVPGQPIGMSNRGDNCWANSAFQLLANSPQLLQMAQGNPAIAQLNQDYLRAQNQQQTALPYSGGQMIRESLHQADNRLVAPNGFQDSAVFFEYLFRQPRTLYRFERVIDGVPSGVEEEPFIHFPVGSTAGHTFDLLFQRFCDYYAADSGRHFQKFFQQPPQELLFQVKRFYQDMVQQPGGGVQLVNGVNNNEVPFPMAFNLSQQVCRQGGPQNYACDGFIVRFGSNDLNSGHFVAYIKKDGRWWCCDDARVTLISDHDALHYMKYGYFYHYRIA